MYMLRAWLLLVAVPRLESASLCARDPESLGVHVVMSFDAAWLTMVAQKAEARTGLVRSVAQYAERHGYRFSVMRAEALTPKKGVTRGGFSKIRTIEDAMRASPQHACDAVDGKSGDVVFFLDGDVTVHEDAPSVASILRTACAFNPSAAFVAQAGPTIAGNSLFPEKSEQARPEWWRHFGVEVNSGWMLFARDEDSALVSGWKACYDTQGRLQGSGSPGSDQDWSESLWAALNSVLELLASL